MRTHAPTLLHQTAPPHARVWGFVKRTSMALGVYFASWRDAWIAAAIYQHLSRLSDAELERRGIARGDMGRHVSNYVDR
jgi:hypothetical protein